MSMVEYEFECEGATEFYVVEKTVELVVTMRGQSQRLRIEALRRSDGVYSVSAYIRRRLASEAFPGHDGDLIGLDVWASYDLPWTRRDSADDAIQQGLSFLEAEAG